MRYLSLFMIVMCLAFSAHAAYAKSTCEILPSTIEKDIKAGVAEIRGVESCEYRKIAHGKLTQSDSDDILVVYDVVDPCYRKKARAGSCGNFDVQYWAVYSERAGVYRAIAADAAPKNRIDNISIENGRIVADVYTYAPLDANCCPSIDTKTIFKIVDGRIRPAGKA